MEEASNAPVTPARGNDNSEVGETTNETAMALAANDQHNDESLPQDQVASSTLIPTNYSLFSNPPCLAEIRQRLFEIEDIVELSPADFATYWPYMDNVWSKQRTVAPTKEQGVVTEWYWCRL